MSNIEAEDLVSTSLSIDTNPIALSLPVGSGIFALSGEAWVTQEGVYDDIVLKPGSRYEVRGEGSIVMSATHATAVVYIARPADTAAGESGVKLHVRERAAELRTQLVAHAVAFSRSLRMLGARLLSMGTPG